MDDMNDSSVDTTVEKGADSKQTPAVDNLVKQIQKRIEEDKRHHKKAFELMERDMHVARHGAPKSYPEGFYRANLAGRHVKQKTASLYAKNPKAVARRRESLDFTTWDESPKSIEMAMQTVMQAQQMLATVPVDPATGQPTIDTDDPQIKMMIQGFEAAKALVEDFRQGTQKRDTIRKIGRTLEILFAQALREQKPVDFKTGMKQLVRRACTTGVGYVELAFQREYGPRPDVSEKLADFRARLDHMRVLAEKVGDTEDPVMPDDPEIAELQAGMAALQSEPEIVLREGLIIDFPQSTKVIPDRLCRELVGFIGARHLTIEYLYTKDQVREIFDVDVGGTYKGYAADGGVENRQLPRPTDIDDPDTVEANKGLVCVWKHYDKAAGLVYYVADGHHSFLREPASPDVFVEDFWPVYALTFNAVESESELFPPSDVALMLDMQMEYNRSRQGMREHRTAARPRFVYANGAIEAEDAKALATSEPFSVVSLNMSPQQKVGDMLQAVPVPGVDPNLYETGQFFTDIQLAVGSSEAQFGLTGKATATGEAIAAGASKSSDASSIDDLDSFLTVIARASGQILLREMSEERVMEVVGPGAIWPQLTLAQIADEVFLEVEAGSTGKPNQAVEIDNMQKMAPFLLQLPGMDPHFLAKQFIQRLDDKIDLTEAFAAGMPSIMAQNGLAQIPTGPPAEDPNAQGQAGGDNAPRDAGMQRGSEPAFGNNQV